MIFHLSYHFVLSILFAAGLTAGTIDAIAGGGGLISFSLLLSLGVPPHVALGTNKFQSSVGTFIASFSYYRHGLISFKIIYKGLLFGFLGAALGALSSQLMSSHLLNTLLPFLLLAILIYTLFSPKLGQLDQKTRLNEFWFYIIFGFVMGFYDGFFGPGTGSLWAFALVFFLGYNLIKATAYTKIFNLKSNLIATVCFALGQNIDYRLALAMASGQLIGGRLGAYLAIKKGAALIRPVFIFVVTITIAVLFYQSLL